MRMWGFFVEVSGSQHTQIFTEIDRVIIRNGIFDVSSPSELFYTIFYSQKSLNTGKILRFLRILRDYFYQLILLN
jgi:hypothetical protein